jgi:hypothetical protein
MPDVGELVPLGVIIRDMSGTPVNASAVALRITLPDLSTLDPVVVNPPAVTGYYGVDYVPVQAGRHLYRWVSTDPSLVLEGTFDVLPPNTAGIISLARAKKALRIPLDDHDEDEDVQQVILAATEAAEGERHEVIAPRPVSETRRFIHPVTRVALTHTPVISLTEVVRLGSAGAVLGSLISPGAWVDEANICHIAGWLRGVIQFRYVAGYRVIPAAYQEAVEIIVQHLWGLRTGSSRRPRPGGASADDGTASPTGYALPNRARDLLGTAGPLVG